MVKHVTKKVFSETCEQRKLTDVINFNNFRKKMLNLHLRQSPHVIRCRAAKTLFPPLPNFSQFFLFSRPLHFFLSFFSRLVSPSPLQIRSGCSSLSSLLFSLSSSSLQNPNPSSIQAARRARRRASRPAVSRFTLHPRFTSRRSLGVVFFDFFPLGFSAGGFAFEPRVGRWVEWIGSRVGELALCSSVSRSFCFSFG